MAVSISWFYYAMEIYECLCVCSELYNESGHKLSGADERKNKKIKRERQRQPDWQYASECVRVYCEWCMEYTIHAEKEWAMKVLILAGSYDQIISMCIKYSLGQAEFD